MFSFISKNHQTAFSSIFWNAKWVENNYTPRKTNMDPTNDGFSSFSKYLFSGCKLLVFGCVRYIGSIFSLKQNYIFLLDEYGWVPLVFFSLIQLSDNGYLVVWVQVLWIRGIPLWKGLGFLRVPLFWIPKHQAPNHQINYESLGIQSPSENGTESQTTNFSII